MMSTDFFARIIGMFFFSIAGIFLGLNIGEIGFAQRDLTAVVLGLLGALSGLVLTPFLTTLPLRLVRERINRATSPTFFSGLLGLFVGLVIAALISYPLSLLPSPFGDYLPFLCAVVFSYLGVVFFSNRQRDVIAIMRPSEAVEPVLLVKPTPHGELPSGPMVLLDTSVIIDGRIEDIARTGFIPGTLLIPNFILNELQYIADSSDALRRQRGRRGMEVLANLQKEPGISVVIKDFDLADVQAVDEKLVTLAKRTHSPILTNDYNLNRVAELQGVKILNINELANAVKAVFLPGERLRVEIIQEGKEIGQGVGYLEDGTMIVVENGNEYLGQVVPTIVTKVLQTAAGRMIFSRPEDL